MGTGVRGFTEPTQAEPSQADQLLGFIEVVRDDGKFKARIEQLKAEKDELQSGWKKLDEERATHHRQMQADNTRLADLRKAVAADDRRAKTGLAAIEKERAALAAGSAGLKQRQAAADKLMADHDAQLAARETALKAMQTVLAEQDKRVRQVSAGLDNRESDLSKREQRIAAKESEIASRMAQLNEASAAIGKAMGR